jgi:SNF2 family DNA or RNA helicase
MVDVGKVLAAYDMGVGKTVLTIAAIEELMDQGQITKPGLVVVLSSLKYQWAHQIQAFSDDATALVIDGTPKQREAQYAQALDWEHSGVDYIILGYSQVVDDWEVVKTLPRGFIVADEVTALKSFRSQRSRKMKALRRGAKYRFGLTATPIENGKPEEVFSIMEAIDPSVLGNFQDFDERYIVRNARGWPDHYAHLDELHARLQPAMIRKSQTDPDVAPFLPDTIHRDPVMVPLDYPSRVLYKTVNDELLADLELMELMVEAGMATEFNLFRHYGEDSDEDADPVSREVDTLRGQIMSKLTVLRMLCDHPDLLTISAAKTTVAGSKSGSKYAAELLDRGLLPTRPKTPKLDAVAQYVADHLEVPSHKAVVFSVFVPTLDLIAERLAKYGVVTYSGAMNAKQKEAAKVRFQTDPKIRVLVSSDAGGYGVDLPQANLLVNYDLPWAPGAAAQRNGRIQRVSSTWKTVTVQDFLIQGSIEVRQFEMLSHKGSVASAIIDGRGINDAGGLDLSLTSLRHFLKSPGL